MTTQWQFKGMGCAFVLLAVAGLTACDEPNTDPNVQHLLNGEADDDDHIDFTPVDDEITFRGTNDNGTELNGTALNGRMFNGRMFNGRMFNGTALNTLVNAINGAITTQVRINGTPLTNIQIVSGSLLSAWDTGAASTKLGAQLANTVYKINFDPLASGGEELTFKILGVTQSSLQSDVYFNNVHQLNELDAFETLCRDGAGNPTQAIALPGTWNGETAVRQASTGKFTWACRGASLAKAVEWGYRPWASPDMNEAHQAAMRMIRADYCGNGTTHTTNGNAIDVSDKWNIQVSDTTWDVEAKWGPNGAVCLNTPRKLSHPRNTIPCAGSLPYCTSDGTATGTPDTDPAQYEGLLMTRAVPNNNPGAY